MWKPHIDFITLHYLYIVCLGILGLIVLYPYGNVSSTQAYFFGVSASTESGLNVVDVNEMPLYQQLALYFIPVMGNMQVVSIMVLIFRFFWFRKVLRAKSDSVTERPNSRWRRFNVSQQRSINSSQPRRSSTSHEGEATNSDCAPPARSESNLLAYSKSAPATAPGQILDLSDSNARDNFDAHTLKRVPSSNSHNEYDPQHVTFAEPARPFQGPTEQPAASDDEDGDEKCQPTGDLPPLSRTVSNEGYEAAVRQRHKMTRRGISPDRIPVHRVLSNAFILGETNPTRGHGNLGVRRPTSRAGSDISRVHSRSRTRKPSKAHQLKLSANAMIGRNSNFSNLSEEDKDHLGGIEYRALKLLIKIVLGYYFALHIIGTIGLAIWISLVSDPKYRDYLAECGLNKIWWAIYTSGTMANNLGFTLTPDSMISFRDAVWPILLMTILAYAGHTFYPVLLRLMIWTMSKLYGKDSQIQEPIRFLLDHPRRCYTLLFPSRPTWVLACILIFMNFVDVLLIICLDLTNPEIESVPIAPRFISSIFQAASSRHTGTSTFNLANVNPGVQFSLVVMMYVSIFPIALSVRSSNTYEESSLGIYDPAEDEVGDTDSKSYMKAHVRNQLSFDLWWIFLSCFIICCVEADRIMDKADQDFQVFSLFFEVASAYGNVGLSLGHPTVTTSLAGVLHPASQLILCATMIRGRHRGLPVRLDRAVMLPDNRFFDEEDAVLSDSKIVSARLPKLKKAYTE